MEPVGRVLHVGHVDPQAAVLAQEDHGGPLLLVAGRVPDGHHVLDLEGQRYTKGRQLLTFPTVSINQYSNVQKSKAALQEKVTRGSKGK